MTERTIDALILSGYIGGAVLGGVVGYLSSSHPGWSPDLINPCGIIVGALVGSCVGGFIMSPLGRDRPPRGGSSGGRGVGPQSPIMRV